MSEGLEGYAVEFRQSDYEGWIAYIDGVPIFEHVDFKQAASGGAGLAQPAPGSLVLPYRGLNRSTRPWKEIRGQPIDRVELYFAREALGNAGQPILRFDRPPGDCGARFIVLSIGGLVLSARAEVKAKKVTALERAGARGQERLGRVGYRMGYWIAAQHECTLYEVLRNGRISQMGPVRHPCWPKPRGVEIYDPARHGFALSPAVVGLTKSQVEWPRQPLIA